MFEQEINIAVSSQGTSLLKTAFYSLILQTFVTF